MRILLYYHAGSKNHGCEAIVRTISTLFAKEEIILYSFQPQSDYEFGLNQLVQIKACSEKKKKYSIWERIQIRLHLLQEGAECYQEMLTEKVDWAFSIGGDNYCYPGQPEELSYINREFHKRNVKTALIGCSINPDIMTAKQVREDLARYNYIIARETITYEEMKKYGLKNCFLYPDPAFLLSVNTSTISINQGEYIGINISPLIIKGGKDEQVVYHNYCRLIEYILEKTEYKIMLIPHVTVEWDNDLSILEEFYQKYKNTEKIMLIQEHNCMELKGYIQKCKMVVCARTHVSIAAYSLGIPTLVIGYSVKSKGIAKDLFGTSKNYVIPVEELMREEDLADSFIWIESNYNQIKQQLLEKQAQNAERLMTLPKLLYGENE